MEYNPYVVFNKICKSPLYNRLITEKSDFVGEITTENKPSVLFLKLMDIFEENRNKRIIERDIIKKAFEDYYNYTYACTPLMIPEVPIWLKGKEKCQEEVYDKYHNTMERGSIIDKCLAEDKLKIDLKMIDLYFKDHER